MNTPHDEDMKRIIRSKLSDARRHRPSKDSIILALFGKPPKALDSAEWARYRRLARTTSYYRQHTKNKAQQRLDKSWVKRDILDVLGIPAACAVCGYDKYIGALDFHHIDPATKDGKVTTVEEARKCRLLCANCHREAHANDRKNGMFLSTGRPVGPADPLLVHYMRLSGLSEDVIASALIGRPASASGQRTCGELTGGE